MSGFSGCPGSRTMAFDAGKGAGDAPGIVPSQLRQWPIQLHLVGPQAPYFQGADVLLSADCVPFALGNFHNEHLKGRALAIACPKLDADQGVYREKITALCDEAGIRSLTVIIMQVPCCRGLLGMAIQAVREAQRKVPIRCVVVGLQGDVLQDGPVEI